jgi:hypothetical protein
MTRSISSRRALAAVGALGLALASFMAVSPMVAQASQAQAPDGGQGPPPSTVLFLSVAPRNAPINTAVLFCEPPGGLHPRAEAACADIATADGDFTKLPGLYQVICDDIYDPVIATAFGWWKGRLTWFQRTYANMCELRGDTGPVFPHTMLTPPPHPTVTSPQPTRPTSTVTITIPPPPTITTPKPGPTVTIDPPDTTIPN